MICCDMCRKETKELARVSLVSDESYMGGSPPPETIAHAELCSECRGLLSMIVGTPYELQLTRRDFETRNARPFPAR